ncbi:MAG: 2-oxoacid:acceptor oxidoreductase subunit alpha [Cyclobacteriaceae bacterium]|nr:2-oxoacid:acceptor oxidoreductase subunit alpha [Cyclobacteriaceae bacterium]
MKKEIIYLDEITVRFAGDSGDGMQLAGKQFSDTSASSGVDVNTFPDFPSEIRAPEGTLYGVSAFQIKLGSNSVNTPGDVIDLLVAMNASSLKVNVDNLKDGGIIIANTQGFNSRNLKLAKYASNPLEDESLSKYNLIPLDIESIIKEELKGSGIPPKIVRKSKNFFALGLTYWLFNRPMEPTVKWLNSKFKNKSDVLEANIRVLTAGWNYALKDDAFKKQYNFLPAAFEKGTYRNISGNHAVALGLVVASKKANIPLFLGSYPITPATDILQYISAYKKYGIRHLQAEDEIAGIASAIGASYGGNLAATTTSGPGLSLKIEAIGLAVMTELPLVIVDVQRAGPSTGLPTKPEQSDLFQAMYGRHGEAPLPVIAAASAADCFDMTIEAARLALKYMTPVILLTDGYIAQGTEPWRIPEMDELPDLTPKFCEDPENFAPYTRNPETLARMWAIPGMQGMEHRIGGLEKQDITGTVNQDPDNHQRMVEIRQEKIDRIVNDIPNLEVMGDPDADLLLIGWGSSYGAIKSAVDEKITEGFKVAFVHLKHMNPFPSNLGEIVAKYDTILVPEMNLGQLRTILHSNFFKPMLGLNKVQGQPFKSSEVKSKIDEILSEKEVVQ